MFAVQALDDETPLVTGCAVCEPGFCCRTSVVANDLGEHDFDEAHLTCVGCRELADEEDKVACGLL